MPQRLRPAIALDGRAHCKSCEPFGISTSLSHSRRQPQATIRERRNTRLTIFRRDTTGANPTARLAAVAQGLPRSLAWPKRDTRGVRPPTPFCFDVASISLLVLSCHLESLLLTRSLAVVLRHVCAFRAHVLCQPRSCLRLSSFPDGIHD